MNPRAIGHVPHAVPLAMVGECQDAHDAFLALEALRGTAGWVWSTEHPMFECGACLSFVPTLPGITPGTPMYLNASGQATPHPQGKVIGVATGVTRGGTLNVAINGAVVSVISANGKLCRACLGRGWLPYPMCAVEVREWASVPRSAMREAEDYCYTDFDRVVWTSRRLEGAQFQFQRLRVGSGMGRLQGQRCGRTLLVSSWLLR